MKVNGAAVEGCRAPGSYVELDADLEDRRPVDLVLPKTLRLEPLPDNPAPRRAHVGPAGARRRPRARSRADRPRGDEEERRARAVLPTVPVFVTPERAGRQVAEAGRRQARRLPDRPASGATATWSSRRSTGCTAGIYGAYWDLFTPDEWQARRRRCWRPQEAKRQLEAATVAFVQPGQMQAERDFNQQGEGLDAGPGRTAATAAGRTTWFSFDLPVDPAHPMALVVTYRPRRAAAARRSTCSSTARRSASRSSSGRARSRQSGFFDVEYPIPAERSWRASRR